MNDFVFRFVHMIKVTGPVQFTFNLNTKTTVTLMTENLHTHLVVVKHNTQQNMFHLLLLTKSCCSPSTIDSCCISYTVVLRAGAENECFTENKL